MTKSATQHDKYEPEARDHFALLPAGARQEKYRPGDEAGRKNRTALPAGARTKAEGINTGEGEEAEALISPLNGRAEVQHLEPEAAPADS